MAKKKQKPLDLLEPMLTRTFGLERIIKPTPLLKEWLSATGTLLQKEIETLGRDHRTFFGKRRLLERPIT